MKILGRVEKMNGYLMCKIDVSSISTAFCYGRCTMGMEKLTIYFISCMQNILALPSLANNYFISLRDENDDPIYTYTDPFMRFFVRFSVKGGRCNSVNQHYKSEISDEFHKFISKELNSNGNICDHLERYFEFLNKYEKMYAKEFNSKNEDYRDINQKEKTDCINKKLLMLPILEQLSKLNLNYAQMDFDANSLYPSAMWDDGSIYPKTPTGFAFNPHTNDIFDSDFINQTFDQNGNESGILKKNTSHQLLYLNTFL